ncbi:capsular polysaccharide biosynthesis protein [Burkholderia pyrrocinia]|uniref:capsular polysaccharide biosynthesis protein n=1 Tax=Burkholderia pyrrocinia TaxID=60550 RepID=UPI0039F00D26
MGRRAGAPLHLAITSAWRIICSGGHGSIYLRPGRRIDALVSHCLRWLTPRVGTAGAGPIAHRGAPTAPPLSWFEYEPQESRRSRRRFIEALDDALATHARSESLRQIARLMQRVLDTNALHHWRATTKLPSDLVRPQQQPSILIIDERAVSEVDVDTPARQRRAAFRAMMKAARTAHPDATCWLLRSCDPGTGKWLSSRATDTPPTMRLLPDACSLRDVLRHVDVVYVISASEGVAALLAGLPVHVFGTPYYAGWGLTQDNVPMPDRHARPTLERLFSAVFLQAARYLDPTSHNAGTLDAVLDSIALQQTTAERFADLGAVSGIRFQWWKRPFATPFLAAGGGKLRWIKTSSRLSANECAVLWGTRSAAGIAAHVRVVRIEDGFLHSNGLGSDMIAPCSQVLDRRSLYFDPTVPSDLNILLNEAEFTPAELTRAATLRADIVRFGLTKYNLGRQAPTWHSPPGQRVILVAGQVADDASIRLGTRGITTSEALLAEVRTRRPDAFIVYKPHPDVLSGNRTGLVDASRLADVVDLQADLISLIDSANEVHTLSSLAGFDALLRGKDVFTYGLPFYAGWGLTHDALPQPWRHRSLSLDMLTAGALLRYPLYWDWILHLYTTPEAVVHQLTGSATRPLANLHGNRLRPLRKAYRWTRNVLLHAAWLSGQSRRNQESI